MAGDIGYGNPPKHTRFKKGNTEYLKRKRKDRPDEAVIFAQFINTKISVNGKPARRRGDLFLDKPFRDALRGDPASAQDLLDVLSRAGNIGDINPTTIWVEEEDMRV